MAGEPRYETAYELGQRIGHTDSVVCADCGVFVMDKAAHTRFHSTLAGRAWALAVLKTSHASQFTSPPPQEARDDGIRKEGQP